MPATVLSNGSRVLTSEVLGLELRLQADSLRFYNPLTGEKLLNPELRPNLTLKHFHGSAKSMYRRALGGFGSSIGVSQSPKNTNF